LLFSIEKLKNKHKLRDECLNLLTVQPQTLNF
jgi:hypothetical protein